MVPAFIMVRIIWKERLHIYLECETLVGIDVRAGEILEILALVHILLGSLGLRIGVNRIWRLKTIKGVVNCLRGRRSLCLHHLQGMEVVREKFQHAYVNASKGHFNSLDE